MLLLLTTYKETEWSKTICSQCKTANWQLTKKKSLTNHSMPNEKKPLTKNRQLLWSLNKMLMVNNKTCNLTSDS